MMRNRFAVGLVGAALTVAVAPASAQAPPVTGVCVMYCNTPTPGMGGGMGGIDAAATGISLGITLFSILNEMNQQPAAPGSAPAVVAPSAVGSYTAARPAPWKPTWAAPEPSALTLQQRAALLGQIRPVSTGTYVSEPTSPQTTTEVQSEKTAILDMIRPVNPTPTSGAGVTSDSSSANSAEARKAAMLRQMRPLDGRVAAGARPANAADQLCAAAGQSAGCISQFVPHGMAPPPGVDFASAPQAAHAFNAAFDALAALPSIAADATADNSACAQIVGFAVHGDQVQSQTAPCGGAAAAGSDEAISAAARVPFDTAGPQGGGDPAVEIDHPDATVALLRAPVITPDALDDASKSIRRDACARLADLEKKLASYQGAMQRLQATAPMIASEQREWLTQQHDAYQALWKDAADIMIDRLDAHYDKQLEELNDKARQAFRMRKNAIDPEFRDKFDEFFLRFVLQKRGIAAKKKYLVGFVMEGTSHAIELADWLETEDRYEKITAIVKFALTSDWVVGPEIAQVTGRADIAIDTILDGTRAWRSAGVLATLDRSSALYDRGLATLQSRIDETLKSIGAAQAELAREKRGCAAA